MDQDLEEAFRPSRLRALLERFAVISDPREAPKVRYPLCEVLFLTVAATIADCEDYEEIAQWGAAHLPFLRRFSEFHFGTPCADWLRVVMNRIDPELFQACFTDWALSLGPDAPKLIAIDGKTSRRTHDRARGRRALHMVSAWATSERLVLAQEAVDEKANECAAIPELLDRLDIAGALVTIDAIACNPAIAAAITSRDGDYLIAVKANQPTLHREIAAYFADPAARAETVEELDRATAGWRPAATPSAMRSTGCPATGAFRTSRACPVSAPSPASRPRSRRPARPAAPPVITSPPRR